MHAVALTVALAEPLPLSLAVLAPLTVLIGASRVALGLHYPSDVLVGALLGAAVAWCGALLP
jgi:undecaprenyl-diphosphatase